VSRVAEYAINILVMSKSFKNKSHQNFGREFPEGKKAKATPPKAETPSLSGPKEPK
jgi:hypothetical protein